MELQERIGQAYVGMRDALRRMAGDAADDGGWNPTQVLAHIAFWDRYQTKRLGRAVAGLSLPTEMDEQALAATENDTRAAMERRSRGRLLAESEAARAALLEFVSSLSEESLHARYEEGAQRLSMVQLLHQVGIWHVRAHTASLPGGEPYSGDGRHLDADYFPHIARRSR